MTNRQMTRCEMQTEALIVENLLEAAMSLQADTDRQDAVTLIEMAHARIQRLGTALDSVNAPEDEA